MLVALWSPKGGSGTSVLAAACALVLGRRSGPARLADLAGDQAAILGLPNDPSTGLADWIAAGPGTPTEALDQLGVDVGGGVVLLPRGDEPRALAPVSSAESGAALAVALRDGPPTVADLGGAADPARRALLEVADVSVVVLRGCYLALRRAVRSPMTERAAGVALVDEGARALGAREVADVTGLPVLARIPVRPPIARAVDAGVLTTRLPEPLARGAGELLRGVGLGGRRTGEAA